MSVERDAEQLADLLTTGEHIIINDTLLLHAPHIANAEQMALICT